VEISPVLGPRDKIHYPISHDECCVHANDQVNFEWIRNGEQPLRQKSRGRIVHISSFVMEHCGTLALTAAEIALQLQLPKEPLPPTASPRVDVAATSPAIPSIPTDPEPVAPQTLSPAPPVEVDLAAAAAANLVDVRPIRKRRSVAQQDAAEDGGEVDIPASTRPKRNRRPVIRPDAAEDDELPSLDEIDEADTAWTEISTHHGRSRNDVRAPVPKSPKKSAPKKKRNAAKKGKSKQGKAADPEAPKQGRTYAENDWVPPQPPAPFTAYQIPSFDACRIIYPGANHDPWWDMPQLIAQVSLF
jgi:hypothetical protein